MKIHREQQKIPIKRKRIERQVNKMRGTTPLPSPCSLAQRPNARDVRKKREEKKRKKKVKICNRSGGVRGYFIQAF